MKIRPATPYDTAAIAEFNLALARETEDLHLPSATVYAGVRALLEDPAKGLYFVAEIDGQVAGQMMITYEWSDWRNGVWWWLQSVYVAAPFRQQGVFKELLEFVRAEARGRADVCGLRLYMDFHNHTARRAYERNGMVQSNYIVFAQAQNPGA
ncbi:MAG TPA: GNAT family N-acetyltransferase [Verrucomicrobiae bacterium]|jgi:GNAT superfamily N-acetyltransferase|nr:GNAT family N-acetyltransferase [Verrucomicrobiae bacterium]